jgi:hypothetical protein
VTAPPLRRVACCLRTLSRVPVLPDDHLRWRCGGCGNLTRFDVSSSRRTTEYWHFDLAGDHRVEQTEVLDETVETVRCRWCGRDDAIELIGRADA